MMNRKDFLITSLSGLTLTLTNNAMLQAKDNLDPEPYKLEIVKEFVSVGHGDFARLKVLYKEYPNLIYSAYDWGNGDFETALEAAGHMGNQEIANFLLEVGARPNVFVMTMLGKTKWVKTILEEFPALLNSKGPHGFTLLHHAQKGGKNAEKLLQYLESKGLKETQFKIK
jgi:ankyrin repeat protein